MAKQRAALGMILLAVVVGLWYLVLQPEIRYTSAPFRVDQRRLENLAGTLFTRYLDEYTRITVEEKWMLHAYKIHEIKLRELTDTGFVFWVRYSIQPHVEDSNWVQVNGTPGEERWIENNTCLVTVVHNEDDYEITDVTPSS